MANFVGDDGTFVGTFPALALEELAAGEVDDAGRVAFGAPADIDADDPAVDPVGAGVIAEAIGAGFPGHEVSLGSGADVRGATQTSCGPRAAGRML
jgi:hypothetical protein